MLLRQIKLIFTYSHCSFLILVDEESGLQPSSQHGAHVDTLRWSSGVPVVAFHISNTVLS